MVWIKTLLLLTLSVKILGQPKTKIHVGACDTLVVNGSDNLIVDTLIMEDSSIIRLTNPKNQVTIKAGVAIIGLNCLIDGKGKDGSAGAAGQPGSSPVGPCRDGGDARNGARGANGSPGVNLFLYLDKLIVNGNLIIDLAGGNGGDGGHGGDGGGGSPGTVHCSGGDGGDGGDAGAGGNGGNGGTVTFAGADLENIRQLIGSEISVNTIGGNFGYAGIVGSGGYEGLGPGQNSGKPGVAGKEADRGRAGNNGSIQFEKQ